ncbi:ABC transporter ATP-binding protein [Paenibacillus sp. FSL H8-0332]|uniref:ABC transporter ATP-binding protein n=1 Tax=Paenibacillus sp. FSL H8-0332 TaxID=2954742 RepID=UPI0030CC7E47
MKRKSLIYTSVLFSLIFGVLPYFNLLTTKHLLNEITELFTNGNHVFSTIILLLCAQFILQVVSFACSYIQQYLEKKNITLLEHSLRLDVFNKLNEMPLCMYDDPEFHNHLNRINSNLGTRFWEPLKNFSGMISVVITLSSYAVILFSVHWSLIILCIVASIPSFILYSFLEKKRYKFNVKNVLLSREINFINGILTERDNVKELKVFALGRYFQERWSQKYLEYTKGINNLDKEQSRSRMILDTINSVFYILFAVFLVYIIKRNKNMLIGNFVIANQALINTQTSLRQLSNFFSETKGNVLFLNDYFEFLNIPINEKNIIADEKVEYRQEAPYICFKNVYFKYKNQGTYTLRDINLSINQGEKIAIIGENGSGKSTLLKCLAGLYTETEGDILLEGRKIREMPEDEIQDKFSVIFQDFIKYPYSIKENIMFGNIQNSNDSDIIEAAQHSNIHSFINGLPDGYDTYLGNYLKIGIDFSGGQWQKLAISRALFKNSDILILDEPTSSLDSKSEIDIYNHLFNVIENKTIIFVSHRIAAARNADKIIMIKDGVILEEGNHEALLNARGEYYKLYHMQLKYIN